MRHGYIKTGAAAVEIAVANPDKNKIEIVRAVEAAHGEGAKLLALPELCVTGCSCGDLFFQERLLSSAESALGYILEKTAHFDVAFAVGLPVRHGSKIYNCAAVCHKGKLLGIAAKQYLADSRHFASASSLSLGETHRIFGGDAPFGRGLVFAADNMERFAFAVEIGEDLWAPDPPSRELCAKGATIILNPSAEGELVGSEKRRRDAVNSTGARLKCAYVYAGAPPSESTQDGVFSGHLIISENGAVLAESEPFGEKTRRGLITADIDVDIPAGERVKTPFYCETRGERVCFSPGINETKLTRVFRRNPFIPDGESEIRERCELIFRIQTAGLKKRMTHSGVEKAVIGISGGLDSTLALLAAVRVTDALKRPRKAIVAVTMPCFGTTSRTKSNAIRLCEYFGVDFREIDISQAVERHFKDIGLEEGCFNSAYENAQARERTQVLMDIANMENGLVVGTGDLSELALGWCTYNGDHMSMYGVNASIPKTLVRHMVKRAAENAEGGLSAVLSDILDTPVSPELLPPEDGEIGQKTESIIGPYELHDFFLYYMVRRGFSREKIFRIAAIAFEGVYDSKTIADWLKIFIRRFFSQQFKRSCMPDGARVGSVTLSPRGGWVMPSDADSGAFFGE